MSASTDALPDGPLLVPGAVRTRGALNRFLRRPTGVLGLALTVLFALTARFAESIAISSPYRAVDKELLEPSWSYPMGTNGLGRDLFSSVVYGIRTSMTVVVWVVLISSVIGISVGILAGYRGGMLDDLAMRVTELFQAVPRFFLALMVLAMFGQELRNLIILLGITSWSLLARVVRAETLSVRDREFVEAARSLGASPPRVLVRHVLPNVLPAGLVIIALTASRVILIEATLRFLGIGDPSVVSLGSLARDGQVYLHIAWWMPVFPGLAIALAAVAFNLVADAVSEVLNPAVTRTRLRRAMIPSSLANRIDRSVQL